MITFLTGNILESEAEALVNTVNCEGFMGKGLAYQFKKSFPQTNKSYVQMCNRNELSPGKMHYFRENNKFIINFPTKDKWRRKSEIDYIEKGMNSLVKLIEKQNITSIAIPPLGSGNGGLDWKDVKSIIWEYIYPISNEVEIYIYEPSLNYKAQSKKAPKLTLSHFILMNIKNKLNKFSKLRLQKVAFFINLFSKENYFKFEAHLYGPYSHSIDIISKDIKEFQEFHKFNTEDALEYAYNTLISKSVEQKLNDFLIPLEKSTNLINKYSSDKDIELYSTIAYILSEQTKLNSEKIIEYIHNWSDLKKEKFENKTIEVALVQMIKDNIIQKDIFENFSIN